GGRSFLTTTMHLLLAIRPSPVPFSCGVPDTSTLSCCIALLPAKRPSEDVLQQRGISYALFLLGRPKALLIGLDHLLGKELELAM
nr:hypothetical protein [Tanacetum cinerariifolium]